MQNRRKESDIHRYYFDNYIKASRFKDNCDRFIINELKRRGINGIVPSHGGILTYLYRNPGPVQMSELAAFIGKTQATTTVLVRKLEDEGLVIRERSAADARVVLVSLTGKGEDLSLTVIDIANHLNDEIRSKITEEECRVMTDILNKLN